MEERIGIGLFAADLETAILKSIDESQHNRKIVALATLALFGLTLWFIHQMISGLTQPLAIAVESANSIAEGRAVRIEAAPKADIGNLDYGVFTGATIETFKAQG